MDQKNTIVKCTANPTCLFNHNGICDNYVITIGADGSCQEYIETEQKTCHPDCIHFDDSDIMVGPMCLFKHPEPLKDFFEGMPCDYYHKKRYATLEEEQIYNKTKEMLEKDGVILIDPKCRDCEHFTDISNCVQLHAQKYNFGNNPVCNNFKPQRGQRAKGNFYDDMMDIDDKHLGEAVTIKMKVAELNETNKNKSIINDWDYAATPNICKTCKKVVYGQPCKYKDVAYGVWTCYEEEKNEV